MALPADRLDQFMRPPMVPRRPLASLVESVQLDLAIHRSNAEAAASCLKRRIPLNSGSVHRPLILYLAKPIFNDDVAALRRFGGRFEYAPILSTDIRRIYYRLVSARYHHNHVSYYRDDNLAQRLTYLSFLRSVLAILHRDVRPAGVLSGNYNYCWQQELAAACKELRLPFVVLHKEGLSVSGQHAKEVARYSNGRFVGDALLAYNASVARALVDAGIENLTDERVTVVGIPRLDGYIRRPPGVGRGLAFFSFDLEANLGNLKGFRCHRSALEDRTRRFYQLPLHFAERHPDLPVVLKFKKAETHRKQLANMLADYGKQLPANVTITMEDSTEALIRGVSVIASCYSTTLLEGMLARRKVMSPDYADLVDGGLPNCFAAYPHLVCRATTLEEFEDAAFNPDTASERPAEQLLQELMFRADGRAANRVEDAIWSTIANINA